MRIYEGDYAYEVERIVSPETQLTKGWRYNVYRIRPEEQLLHSGQVATREEAEKTGKVKLKQLEKQAHTSEGGEHAA